MNLLESLFFSGSGGVVYAGLHSSFTIALLIILLGIAKCISIAKRNSTSSKCVYGLILVLTGLFLGCLYSMLKLLIPEFGEVIMVFGAMLLIIEIAGCVWLRLD
jgi:hypothetical protein